MKLKRTGAVLLAVVLCVMFAACSRPSANGGGSMAAEKSSSAAEDASSRVPPGAATSHMVGEGAAAASASSSDDTASRPYGEWVGVWESDEGVMTIRFSHMVDFVLDCYYYYPDEGFGFQINISEDEVAGNYIHSYMIDPAFDYHAEYEFTLDGDRFDFIYNYQHNIIEESTFAKTDETDIEGTWDYYWNL